MANSSRRLRKLLVVAAALGTALAACTNTQQAEPPRDAGPAKRAEAIGGAGVVASVDPYASAIGLDVLRSGGNAVDAAVATAAALGVTEPYSAGIGGGGFFVYYDAASGKVSTLDGRETAPAAADANYFTENGRAIDFDEAMSSGLAAGVPGTPATWDEAARRWGTRPLAKLLEPAAKLAADGFTVDQGFREQTEENAERFARFPATARLYLPGGTAPAVGSTLRNPDLAATYEQLGREGVGALYRGAIGAEIIAAANEPKTVPGEAVRAGRLAPTDLANYQVHPLEPTHAQYRGLDVYGMAGTSSGGIAVAEALNILERTELRGQLRADVLHRYLEATRLAFADRNRWVGDPAVNDVPATELLSQEFADSRSCLIDMARAAESPVGPGDPRVRALCPPTLAPTGAHEHEGHNTTHLTVADAKGNIVAYSLTIGKIGGNGMVVPGRGFLLTTVLTDFDFVPATSGVPNPNLPGPSKRPRSSMSPTIVLDQGRPLLAVGATGGTSIITTITQTLINRLDLGMPLVDAIAAPRASQRNEWRTEAEPAFHARPELAELVARGQTFSEVDEFGSATGVERLPGGRWAAAAETSRHHGGSAMAVNP